MNTGMELSARRLHARKLVMLLTPEQLRAARGLLDWSRAELAKRSSTAPETIQAFEIGASDPKLSTLRKWRLALQRAGVAFIDPDDADGPGVRLRGRRGD
jgi:transcriptional regulator with XRE-family HTH domain